jgi:excisionase family DNA binding protein
MEKSIEAQLNRIERLLNEQSLLKKEVLNFTEAKKYLDISASYLYKLTSAKKVPHYCPQGKKLYFKRVELDEWLQQNRTESINDIDKAATNFILSSTKKLK